VAVGIGVALAQAERTRRSAKRLRKRERRFTQLPNEPLPKALQRMALGQLDLAIELLADDAPDERAIHETRKALKRLRALVRLLRRELGEPRFRREYGILRDAARRLAGARDAEVMVGTLDALLERHPRELGHHRPLTQLRKRLMAQREAATRRTLGEQATRVEVLSELRGLRARAQWWNLSEQAGITIVERDLRRVYGQGRSRYRYVARGRRRGRDEDTRALHKWRKAVKDLRYGAEMLGQRPLARRADTLGEILGEDHDLALLAALLPPPGRAPFKGKRGKRARKALLEQIGRRRRRLRKRALREGEHLYRRKPKQFIRRARRAHSRA
jgi:CHAD domain-containing protein